MKRILLALAVVLLSAATGTAVVIAKESDPKKAQTPAEKPAAAAADKADEKTDAKAAVQAPLLPPLPFTPTHFKGTAFEAVAENSNLSTFMTALNKSGLAAELKGKGPITVFAPNNDAFTKLPEGFLDSIMADEGSEILKSVMAYHIVPGKILSVHLLREETGVASLKGKPVTLKRTAEGLLFNSALITKSDIETTNGVVHIIEGIDLNPQTLMAVTAPQTDDSARPAPAPEQAPEEPAPEAAPKAGDKKPKAPAAPPAR